VRVFERFILDEAQMCFLGMGSSGCLYMQQMLKDFEVDISSWVLWVNGQQPDLVHLLYIW
jgi:hypothetical protein